MRIDNDVFLSLFTMVVGAILGTVLVPVGDAVAHRLMGRRTRSIYGALLLFFAANGVWIIGEIFAEVFIRFTREPDVGPATAIAVIFGMAAGIFGIGFRYVPEQSGAPVPDAVARAVYWLIIGNILWLSGEVAETFAWAFRPADNALERVVAWLRLGLSVIAMIPFGIGAWTCLRVLRTLPGEVGGQESAASGSAPLTS
jgi:hypothetical protein